MFTCCAADTDGLLYAAGAAFSSFSSEKISNDDALLFSFCAVDTGAVVPAVLAPKRELSASDDPAKIIRKKKKHSCI